MEKFMSPVVHAAMLNFCIYDYGMKYISSIKFQFQILLVRIFIP